MKRRRSPLSASIAIVILSGVLALPATPEDLPGVEPPASDTDEGAPLGDRTPPRLSQIDGEASFWRQGAEDWTQASVNTPLAPGDQLYTGNGSNLELQIGPREFLRAASNSQLAFDNQETDYQQFRLTSGQASVDLRDLRAGQTVEVDTPNGAFTIDHDGYYRVQVEDDATRFVARRGGRATVTTANGDADDIASSQGLVVRGDEVESYAASEPDAWDRWNYERSDKLIAAVSYRHVPETVYGVDDLDRSGRWRVVPRYGSVWFPSSVAPGWAPYTSGRWVQDPYYGWTWIDDAAWGWAPFHYGRWVFVDQFWGWAPGPIVARPVYAPALVAFFSAGPISIGVSLGAPALGWTALGWGEPCRPWWGPANFVGRPRWFGWGGPRVTINQTTIHQVDIYRNARARNGMVVVNRNEFARGPVGRARLASFDAAHLRPVGGALPVRADAARMLGGASRGQRPPRALLDRRVVATRPSAPNSARGWFHRSEAPPNPPAQLVPSPHEARARDHLQRSRSSERASLERAAPPPPRFDGARRGDARGLQRGTSSAAVPAPPRATAGTGARRSGGRRAEPAPAMAAPAAVPSPPKGVDRRASRGATEPRAAAPRAPQARSTQSLRMQSPPQQQRAGRVTTAQRPQSGREARGQSANRVPASRSMARPVAPPSGVAPRNAQPSRAATARRAPPQQVPAAAARDARQARAERADAAPGAVQANAGSQHGRGRRAR